MTDSFNIELNKDNFTKIGKGEGKSSSLFITTYDNKYIIKTISDSELNTFKALIAKLYHDHLAENNNSLLVNIFGIYSLKSGISTIHIVLM